VLDDVERAFGCSKRFGIVRVDYDTHERTVTDSARWYAQVVRDTGF
jgi:beta-glucosidase